MHNFQTDSWCNSFCEYAFLAYWEVGGEKQTTAQLTVSQALTHLWERS